MAEPGAERAGDGEDGAAALPRRARLLYASSSLGSEALLQSRSAWLLFLYAPPEGSGLPQLLPLGLMGLLLAAMRVVDSFDEPLIGWWSDRTASRWGRRAPFVLLGAPLWALSAVLLMSPPQDSAAATVAIWFAVTMQASNLFSTIAGAPYDALIPEIARRDDDRLALATTRVWFGVAGAAVGLVLSGVLVERVGIPRMALAMALMALATRYLGLFGVWSRLDRGQAPARLSLADGVRTTFGNRQFRAFVPASVCFQTAIGLVTASLPFYAVAVLGKRDAGTWVAWLSAAAVLGVAAGAPLYARRARSTTKRHAYRRAMVLAATALPLLGLVGLWRGVPPTAQALAAMFLGSLAMAGAYVFPAALLADIVDEESGRTGLRREGAYYGAIGFLEKTTGALAPLVLTGLMLLGNTPDRPLGVRLAGPVSALLVLAGLWFFRGYSLGDARERAS